MSLSRPKAILFDLDGSFGAAALENPDLVTITTEAQLAPYHPLSRWIDLPGALDVLCNGEYSALPRAIAEVAQKPARSADDPETELERSDRLNLQARVERDMPSKLCVWMLLT